MTHPGPRNQTVRIAGTGQKGLLEAGFLPINRAGRATLGMVDDQTIPTTPLLEDQQSLEQIHRSHTVGPNADVTFKTMLAARTDDDLLDVGCGTGDFLIGLRRQGHKGRLVGVEASRDILERARRAFQSVEFLHAETNYPHLPFGEGTFDLITARYTFETVTDAHAILEETARVLRPGGRLVAIMQADGYMLEFDAAVTEALQDDPDFLPLLETLTQPAYRFATIKRSLLDCFGSVRTQFIHSHLEFHEPEPVLDYWDALRIQYGYGEPTWARGRALLHDWLEERLQEGPWRVSKRVVLFNAVR
jgi:SAM-dependent methyltransferase